MAQDEGKKEEEKLEFDSAGQAVAYISLDQARVLALQHARDNRELYGRYANRELVWDELSAEESEDYYRIRLSYRPARQFWGKPGVELFTIDKAGPIELRQILREPRPRPRFLLPGIVAGVIALVAGLGGGLFAAGVFSSSTPTEPPLPVPTSTSAATASSGHGAGLSIRGRHHLGAFRSGGG